MTDIKCDCGMDHGDTKCATCGEIKNCMPFGPGGSELCVDCAHRSHSKEIVLRVLQYAISRQLEQAHTVGATTVSTDSGERVSGLMVEGGAA